MNSTSMQEFMGWFKWVLAAILLLIVAALVFYSIYDFKKRKGNLVKFIAITGVFGAISSILYCVKIFTFELPFLPPFMSVHLDEIPIFIVGFAYGPLPAIMVTLVKTIIKLPMTSTACVGEIGDFFMTLFFVLPSVILYQKRRKLSSVFIGFGISTVTQITSAVLLNIFVLVPFYEFFYGMDDAALLSVCQKVNPAIQDLGWTYSLFAVLPLNAIKDSIVLVVVFFVYKALHKYLRLSWKKEKIVEEVEEENKEPSIETKTD